MLAAGANDQPAAAAYPRDVDGIWHARDVVVPGATATGIARVTAFHAQGRRNARLATNPHALVRGNPDDNQGSAQGSDTVRVPLWKAPSLLT